MPQGFPDRGNPNLAPFAGSFYSLTGGVNYYPHPNVTIRPEIRYDWFTGGRNPYNDGQKDNQVLVAINAYLQFQRGAWSRGRLAYASRLAQWDFKPVKVGSY